MELGSLGLHYVGVTFVVCTSSNCEDSDRLMDHTQLGELCMVHIEWFWACGGDVS